MELKHSAHHLGKDVAMFPATSVSTWFPILKYSVSVCAQHQLVTSQFLLKKTPNKAFVAVVNLSSTLNCQMGCLPLGSHFLQSFKFHNSRWKPRQLKNLIHYLFCETNITSRIQLLYQFAMKTSNLCALTCIAGEKDGCSPVAWVPSSLWSSGISECLSVDYLHVVWGTFNLFSFSNFCILAY